MFWTKHEILLPQIKVRKNLSQGFCFLVFGILKFQTDFWFFPAAAERSKNSQSDVCLHADEQMSSEWCQPCWRSSDLLFQVSDLMFWINPEPPVELLQQQFLTNPVTWPLHTHILSMHLNLCLFLLLFHFHSLIYFKFIYQSWFIKTVWKSM